MSTDVKNTAAKLTQLAFGSVIKQILFVLFSTLVCLGVGMWISDIFVLTYRAEWDAGNLASGSLSDLVKRLVSIGKIPPVLADTALILAGNFGPKDAVRFFSASAELFAVLVCSFAPRNVLTNGVLCSAVLCPLMFVLITACWDMTGVPYFCDQFGWHCISYVHQCLAVLLGAVIGACRAKITGARVTSKKDGLFFFLFSLLMFVAIAFYDSARGWIMHLG